MNRAITTGVRSFSSTAARSNVIRTWGPVGSWLRDLPNHVPETQRAFAASHSYTFEKKSTDKVILAGIFGTLTVGTIIAGKGK
jgi:hypothetical protein